MFFTIFVICKVKNPDVKSKGKEDEKKHRKTKEKKTGVGSSVAAQIKLKCYDMAKLLT